MELYQFTDHACRHCYGRLMRRDLGDGKVVHRCAECGSSAEGDHDQLCWCGVEVRNHGNMFECYRNPAVSQNVPLEVLVRERPVVKAAEQTPGRRSNPVRIDLPGY